MSEHKTLAEALVAFQAEAPTLRKDGLNPHFKSRFTPLDTIVETVGPLLAKHGLSWSAMPSFGPNGEPALRYKLTHVSGDVLDDVMPLMIAKQDPQGQGSAITYARRYSITAVLNLVSDEDDDGNSASRPKQQQKPANGSADYPAERISVAAIKELQKSAEGLNADQVKLAFTACGIGIPDPLVWNAVPKGKASVLAEALAGMERFE